MNMRNENKSEHIRSFIAIELPDDVRYQLGELQQIIKASHQSSAKWIDPHNIHLTLKFLGNVETTKIDAITKVMQDAAASVPSFQLQIQGLGAFPNLKRVQIIWVGIQGEVEKLLALQKLLDSKIAILGYLPEKRAFVPHLTLARVRDFTPPLERLAMGELISSINSSPILYVDVNSLSLMRSQLTPKGPIYSKLASIKLNSP